MAKEFSSPSLPAQCIFCSDFALGTHEDKGHFLGPSVFTTPSL